MLSHTSSATPQHVPETPDEMAQRMEEKQSQLDRVGLGTMPQPLLKHKKHNPPPPPLPRPPKRPRRNR